MKKKIKFKKKIQTLSCKYNYHNAVTLRSLQTSSQVKMLEGSKWLRGVGSICVTCA